LERVKRIYGYVKKHPDGAVRFRAGEPDYSSLSCPSYEWDMALYGDVQEEIPHDAPPPLGKGVVLTTTYVDANLYHCAVTGRSVTGVLHLINKTPFDWFSKRQGTVESSTFGSEFVAARTGTEQIIDHRLTLRYFGVPITKRTYMFGDHESVVTNSSVPHSQLKKRHVALSYHRVREAIAAGIIWFFHIRSEQNPADVLTKHWAFPSAWPHLKALLFWRGDTSNISSEVAVKAELPPSPSSGGELQDSASGRQDNATEGLPPKATDASRTPTATPPSRVADATPCETPNLVAPLPSATPMVAPRSESMDR
jgi:hypothetical protein